MLKLFIAVLIFSNYAQAKLWDDEKCVDELISLDIPAFPFKAVGKILVNGSNINDIEIVTETGTYNIKNGVASGTASDFDYSRHVVNGMKSAKILFQKNDPDKLDDLLEKCRNAESKDIQDYALKASTQILKAGQKKQAEGDNE